MFWRKRLFATAYRAPVPLREYIGVPLRNGGQSKSKGTFMLAARMHLCGLLAALLASPLPADEPLVLEPALTLPGLDNRPETTRIQDVSLSPEGKTLAAVHGDSSLRLFDLPAGRVRSSVEHAAHRFRHVAFAEENVLVAWGRGVLHWDVEQMRARSSLLRHSGVQAVAFGPKGRTLALGEDRPEFHVWDLSLAGANIATFNAFEGTKPTTDTGLYKPWVTSADVSPDGKSLAVHIHFYEDELPWFDHVQIWDLKSRKLTTAFEGHSCLFTPDGKTLISGLEGAIALWDARTWYVVARLKADVPLSPGALSRDGRTLAAIGKDHALHVWELPSRQPRAVLKGHTHPMTAVSLSHDGTRVVAGSEDGSIRMWELKSK